ncbi:MAG TPA: hypothetical protein VIF15_15570, partial [Polyangiaceae bacterium]
MRGFVFASLFVVGCGGGEFQATGGDDAGDEGDASIGADADAAAQDGSAQDVAQDAASSDSSSGDAATCAPPMTLCTNGSTSVCTDLSSDDKNC